MLSEVAQKIGGTVVSGDKKYPVYDFSPLGMAEEFDLCLVRTDEDALASVNSDAEAFVASAEHVLMLKNEAHIIVTDDVELASKILAEMFS